MNLILIVLTFCVGVQSANILAFFPFPGKSHHAVFQPILIGLANKGHSVTYYTPNLIKNPPKSLKQIELKTMMMKMKEQFDKMESKENETNLSAKVYKWILDNWCNFLVRSVGDSMTEFILTDPDVEQLIKDTNTKYDLILAETTFSQETFAVLAHKFNAHLVEVMPTSNMHWSYYLHGNPYDTNYIMDIDTSYSDHMTFKERLINTLFSMTSRVYNTYIAIPKLQGFADKYIQYPGWETRPNLIDIIKNSSLFFMNTHLAVNYPYPISPNVKLIGGINIKTKPDPLPKDIQDFMDGAKDGVIYFTLGSHIEVSTKLGDKLKDEFLKAFSKVKQRVLWKWEIDFPNVPENVKISKWFPQQGILAHPNMKLFITHGGLLSITEAVHNGVPLIGIPILGDQPKNVNQVKVVGYGVHLDFNNLTETSISWAINEILTNQRYKQIIKERSTILKEEIKTPVETAVYWVEYVLRHNGAHHLKPAIVSMPWCQRALVDVYLTILAIIILPLLLSYYTIKCICKCICCRKSKNKSKSKKQKKE